MNAPAKTSRDVVDVAELVESAKAQIIDAVAGPEHIATRDAAISAAETLGEITADNLSEADAQCADLDRISKDADKRRAAVKEPYLRIGQAIDKARKDFDIPIAKALARLKAGVVAVQQAARLEAERIRIENERKAEQARRKAEAERRAELAALAELEREAKTDEDIEAVVAMADEVDERSRERAAVVLTPEPEPELGSVRPRKHNRLELGDITKIPDFVDGVQVKFVDTAVVRRLLGEGKPVGEAHYVVEEIWGTRTR